MATIVIVEDNPDNMKLIQALLRLKGHALTGLENGAGLMEALERERPELVLMDIQLPERDGYALLGDIRNSAHAATRVIALTAHAMAGDRERALAAGFDGYITKPISVREFPEQVARVLAGERPDT